MKNETVKKINTLGKIMRILLNITKALLIVATVAIVVMGIGFGIFLPSDSLKSKGSVIWQVVEDDTNIPSFLGDDFFNIEEGEEKVDTDAFKLEYKSTATPSEENEKVTTYDVTGSYSQDDIVPVKIMFAVVCTFAAVICVTFIIALIFGSRLAKAFEKCDSPFEAKVLKAMKAFAFSLIPWAIIKAGSGSASGVSAIIFVLVAIMFSYIFSYGAQLQKESDETI